MRNSAAAKGENARLRGRKQAKALSDLNQRFVFLVPEYRYFHLHWLPLAKAICAAGGQLTLLTRVGKDDQMPQLPGLDIVPLDMRRGLNPLHDLWLFLKLTVIFLRLKPDLTQLVSLKAALLGSLPALLAGTPKLVNVIQGFGYLFGSGARKARILSRLLLPFFKWLVNRRRCATVVQNRHDLDFVRGLAKRPDSVTLIPGVGVDLARFQPSPEPDTDECRVLLPTRFLWSKGVGEFVAAARELKRLDASIRMTLVGAIDEASPDTVTTAEIQAWVAEGLVESWGYQQDMAAVYRQAHIVCLPTAYREGLPTVLLEAAASARALIASDTPACRELITHNKNGLLVPPKDAPALAAAILSLAHNPASRRRYAKTARATVAAAFATPQITAAYQALHTP